ncbi:MAG: prolyl oligopeptidase family serine peptidase, partial [Planctomycetota bacterium]
LIDEVSPTFISYKRKFFLHFDDDDREIVWMSERDGWNHLYLIDGRRGKVKNRITRGKWVVRNVEHVDKERREIWFSASGLIPGQDPYYLHLCRVNFDGSGMTVLTDGDGTHEWAFSPDRRYFVDSWSRVDEPPVTVLRDARTGKVVCRLERADASRLFATGWIAPEPLAAKGRDGETDIHGIIVRPSNFSTEKTYPVVEYIYAGPHSAFVPKAFGMNRILHEMAELGFVVVQIDGMGTSWRSKAFHDVCWGNLSDGGFPDRVRWIRAAAENVPQMDLSRVGIHGGSAGGQNAMSALLSFPDFYHVGVADCGCHDNRVDKAWWNELYMGYPVGPQYAKNSNVERAHLLKGKLFLIVGELDKNVDPSSTLQVVDALIKADKDFDLLVMPGVGHAAARTEYGRRRLMDFMVRNLHGVEPRRDAGKVPSSLAEADPVTVPSEP